MATKEWKEKNIEKLREYRRAWYKKNSDRAKKAVTDRKKVLRDWIKEVKSVLKCLKCGESDPACLDFHHSDPSKKEFSIARATTIGYSKDRILEEMSKAEVLCANCHRKLHYYERTHSSTG